MLKFGRASVGCLGLMLLACLGTGCGAQETELDPGELTALIDSLLPSISEASGLEVRRPVRFAVQSRAAVRSFIIAQLDEEMEPGELEGMEAAYKAFGLLPDTLDLRGLLLELYTEQVVGYYDPRTDRLYVVEGVERSEAVPVVAHELVHALQDQLVPLDSLVERERGNDRQLAAQAAAEGQATLVMLALQAEQATGRRLDPGQLPEISGLIGPALEAQNTQFPVFSRAPRLIRETMLFPYVAGAAFVQGLHRGTAAGGPVVPFGDLLPQSTEQVLDPDGFLAGPDAPTELRLDDPGRGWQLVYGNTLGQLEVSILLEEHLGSAAAAAARGWDGDRYALLAGPDGDRMLVWYSVWDDDAAADRFAEAYRRVLASRPARSGHVRREELGGRPVVRVVESADGVDAGALPVPGLASLEERQRR